MFRLVFQSLNRRSPLKRSRWRSLYHLCIFIIFLLTLMPFLISIFYSMFLLQPNFFDSHVVDVIISLTTTPARFHYELPLAIHSLLCQTELPKQIRIYLSPASVIKQQPNMTLAQLRSYVQNLDSSEIIMKLFNDLVDIWLEEEDLGPATKFLPIIKEFKGKSQRILICDDDQYYHPYTLATLYRYSARYPKSILGFRGWRGKIHSIVH